MSIRFIAPASIKISRRRSIVRAEAQGMRRDERGIQRYSALPEFGRPLMARNGPVDPVCRRPFIGGEADLCGYVSALPRLTLRRPFEPQSIAGKQTPTGW